MKELSNQEGGLDIGNMNMCLVGGTQCALLGWHTNQVTGERTAGNREQCIQSTTVHEQEPIAASEVHIDDSIAPEGREELMLLINEYRDVFAKNMKKLSCTNLIKVDLTKTQIMYKSCVINIRHQLITVSVYQR